MINPMSLKDKVILITGAGQGLGLATAELSYQLDAAVVLVDVNSDSLEAAAAKFDADRVLAMSGSVANPAFVESVMAAAEKKFGAVHGLVNNAGIIRPAMIEKMTEEQWREVIDINLTGCYYFLQSFGRHALARVKDGKAFSSIVNISSIAGRIGSIGQINYSAAKAGLFGLTMSAAREWAKYEIRANSVCFGMVETPMTKVIRGEKFREMMLARIPMGRWSQVDEAVKPVCFLLSDAASFITGQTLSVDGGAFMSA